jgi:hypothetical protein
MIRVVLAPKSQIRVIVSQYCNEDVLSFMCLHQPHPERPHTRFNWKQYAKDDVYFEIGVQGDVLDDIWNTYCEIGRFFHH